MNRANRPRLSRISGSSYASKLMGRAGIDPTPGYQEQIDGGTATTTLYPYVFNGENAAFTAYTTNLDGGQATNPV
jgi:hypothetical protein